MPFDHAGVDGSTPPEIFVISFADGFRALRKGRVDILHMHSVYAPVQGAMAVQAKLQSIPYLITPHGGYHPRILARHNLPKRIYRSTGERWRLRSAATTVAVAHGEVDDIRAFAQRERLACEVIPNIVDGLRPTDEGGERAPPANTRSSISGGGKSSGRASTRSQRSRDCFRIASSNSSAVGIPRWRRSNFLRT